MPAKERLGCDHERGPTVPAERAARGRKERPIPVAKLRPADRTSEHLHLVTEDGVLELELCDDATPGEQPDEAYKHEIGEGSQGAKDATDQRQSERIPVLEPHRSLPAFSDAARRSGRVPPSLMPLPMGSDYLHGRIPPPTMPFNMMGRHADRTVSSASAKRVRLAVPAPAAKRQSSSDCQSSIQETLSKTTRVASSPRPIGPGRRASASSHPAPTDRPGFRALSRWWTWPIPGRR